MCSFTAGIPLLRSTEQDIKMNGKIMLIWQISDCNFLSKLYKCEKLDRDYKLTLKEEYQQWWLTKMNLKEQTGTSRIINSWD